MDKSVTWLVTHDITFVDSRSPMTSANPERIEVINSTENIIDTYLLALHNAKSRWFILQMLNH